MRITWSIGLPPPLRDWGCHLMVSYRGWVQDRFVCDAFFYHAAYCTWQPVIDILEAVFPGENVEYSQDRYGDIIIGGKHAQGPC